MDQETTHVLEKKSKVFSSKSLVKNDLHIGGL